MLMAKVFDFRNSKSYFFLKELLTASPLRPAGLENPNIAIKNLRASQLKELRALPTVFWDLGQKGVLKVGTEVHSQPWTMMDKGMELGQQLPSQAVCRGQRSQAAQGEGFLPVPSKHENACCGQRRVHRGKQCFR